MINGQSTINEIFNFLRHTKNWTTTDNDVWNYCKITDKISIGRTVKDWAIFIKGKNIGFFYTNTYKSVPEDLITKLKLLLNEETK